MPGPDASALVVPGHGTVFKAAKNTILPTGGLSAFTLTGTPPTGWANVGHTSSDNMVSFSIDGGDATVLRTWLQDAVRTIYDSVAWSLSINALQFDKPTLDLAFNGGFDANGGYTVPGQNGGTEAGLFVLCQDTTASVGFYIPNTTVKLGDSPSFDTANFIELPLSAQILTAASTAIAPLADGRAGIMQIFKSGLTAA
jgi:hypothetical protein